MHRLLRKQQKNDNSNTDIKRFVKGRPCGDEKHLGAVIVAKQAFRELYRNVTNIMGKWKIKRTKTFHLCQPLYTSTQTNMPFLW